MSNKNERSTHAIKHRICKESVKEFLPMGNEA